MFCQQFLCTMVKSQRGSSAILARPFSWLAPTVTRKGCDYTHLCMMSLSGHNAVCTNSFDASSATKVLSQHKTQTHRATPKEWQFTRTWTDFAKLDRAMRKKYPDQLNSLPPKPYLVGEEVFCPPFNHPHLWAWFRPFAVSRLRSRSFAPDFTLSLASSLSLFLSVLVSLTRSGGQRYFLMPPHKYMEIPYVDAMRYHI